MIQIRTCTYTIVDKDIVTNMGDRDFFKTYVKDNLSSKYLSVKIIQ